MPISFNCPKCGKPYMTSDETAGKRARCKQCGNTMTIPQGAGRDPYALADAPAPPPRRGFDDEEEVLPRRPAFRPEKKKSSGPSAGAIGGVASVMGVIAIIVVRIALRLAFSQMGGKGQNVPQPPFPPPAVAVNPDGPIALPAFPEMGPGRPLEPGIDFHEIRLPGGPQPGFGGKLWLYLPSGAHPDHSLPCVLITGAGSNLMTGMDLSDGDRPEHLPYVRAGFAVLAFELDGALANLQGANDTQILAAARKFVAARAGLVNAHIALEYARAKVPQVDPDRLYTAGHSSAATLALLFAENEPRLKGCVAFAPAIDVAQRLAPAAPLLHQQGLGDLLGRYSPRNGEARLSCPVFLFHAQDDSNVPVSSSIACAQRLQGMGKAVTLDTVPTGDHYDSMIHQGIPRAIAWLQGLSGQHGHGHAAPQPVPPTGPVPPPNAGGFPAPAPPSNGPPGAGGFPPPPRGPGPMPPPPGFRGPRFRRPPGMPR